MDIEAYKVAVRLSLTENITRGLMAVSGGFIKAEHDAAKFQQQLHQIGKMTLAGGALVGISAVLAKGIDSTLDAAKRLNKAMVDFETLNLTAQDNTAVKSNAVRLSHEVLGTTIAGNIKLTQDLHTAFGDLGHAMHVSDAFARYETATKMALGEGSTDGMVNAAARALEHRGGKVVNDPAEFARELAMMSQVQFATKNRVSPKDFLTASQSGKMAYTLMSPEFLYGKFAGLLSMEGGFPTGTRAMTYFSSLIGGHMDKKAKGFLADLGLYQEGVSKDRLQLMQGAMKGMSPQEKQIYLQSVGGESLLAGGVKDQYLSMAVRNPDQFAAVMADKIRGKYGKDLSDEKVAEIMAKSFNRNTGQYLGQLVLNAQKLSKDEHIFRQAMAYDAAYQHYLKSPEGAATALSASWENLKAILGLQLLPVVTKITFALAKLTDKISKFAEDNPMMAKFIMYTGMVLTGLTAISGVVLLLGGAFMAARLVSSLGMLGSIVTLLSGPVALAVAAIGVGVWAYLNWDKLKPELKKMGDEFGQIMTEVWGVITGAFNHFAGILTTGFNILFDGIIGLLNKMLPESMQLLTSKQQATKDNAQNLWMDIAKATGRPVTALPVPVNTNVTAPKSYNQQLIDNYKPKSSSASYTDQLMKNYPGASKGSPYVKPGSDRPVVVHTQLNMDSRKVATATTRHQANDAVKALRQSTTQYDPLMTPPTVPTGR